MTFATRHDGIKEGALQGVGNAWPSSVLSDRTYPRSISPTYKRFEHYNFHKSVRGIAEIALIVKLLSSDPTNLPSPPCYVVVYIIQFIQLPYNAN